MQTPIPRGQEVNTVAVRPWLLVVCEWRPAARLGDQVAPAVDPCAVPIRASQRHGWLW